MRSKFKLNSVVMNFILWQKHKDPEISCRKLAEISSKRFHFQISKSSVSSVLKSENLSSPVGRRGRKFDIPKGEVENGGCTILQGIDEYFGLSEIVVKSFAKRLPAFPPELLEEAQKVVKAFIIFKSIFCK